MRKQWWVLVKNNKLETELETKEGKKALDTYKMSVSLQRTMDRSGVSDKNYKIRVIFCFVFYIGDRMVIVFNDKKDLQSEKYTFISISKNTHTQSSVTQIIHLSLHTQTDKTMDKAHKHTMI